MMFVLRTLSSTTLKTAIFASVSVGALTLASVETSFAQGQGHGSGGSEASGGDGSGNHGSGAGGDGGQRASGGAGSGGQGHDGVTADDESDDGDGTPDWAGDRGGNPDQGADQSGDSGRPEGTGGRPDDVGGGDEDSDRPEWAGTPGGSAGRGTPPDAGGGGDLYGDLYVILRDAQGVPILSDAGFVQPVAADGSLIPLDEEGHVIDESLVQEVDIGRLNVSRAPEDVLEGRSEEVLDVLNSATAISFDPAGRLVVTVDGVTRTIDSPLENLSIYVALMETGTIEGVDNPALGDLFLVDGVKDAEDLAAATSFLAAATDKAGTLTTDDIAYINLILDIDTTNVEGSEVIYSDVDYSGFVYDRTTTYGEVLTTVLVEQPDGSWLPTEVNIFDAVFTGVDDTSTDGTFDAFTQAADDARAVINFIHEYEVPVSVDQL